MGPRLRLSSGPRKKCGRSAHRILDRARQTAQQLGATGGRRATPCRCRDSGGRPRNGMYLTAPPRPPNASSGISVTPMFAATICRNVSRLVARKFGVLDRVVRVADVERLIAQAVAVFEQQHLLVVEVVERHRFAPGFRMLFAHREVRTPRCRASSATRCSSPTGNARITRVELAVAKHAQDDVRLRLR